MKIQYKALVGFIICNDGDLQKVADWVLAKPYENIVAP